MMAKFYTERQNNSGGYYEEDKIRGIASIMCIEANSPQQATEILEKLVESYSNYCECCGGRWSLYFDYGDGYDSPQLYGRSIFSMVDRGEFRDGSYGSCAIHYLDGTVDYIDENFMIEEKILNTAMEASREDL